MSRAGRLTMNGITGGMGYRQHLVRSNLAIREQGGVELTDGTGHEGEHRTAVKRLTPSCFALVLAAALVATDVSAAPE